MDINGRPDHIEDYLAQLHGGQWFGWSDSKNKVYANLVILDSSKSKPSESDCTTGLADLQTAYDNAKTKQTTDATSGKTKLKNLGLTDDEIKALMGK
jgi:hypothetical protein|tara:strand:+ start:412 stop:702 length:291 start_codon:yes stop_codon:yes gene_type:complete